jgi:hypothetical protein
MEARSLKVVANSPATSLVNRPAPGLFCRSLISGVIDGPAAVIIEGESISAVCRSRRRSRRDPHRVLRDAWCSGSRPVRRTCSHPDHLAAN